jgi:hypothetical protein
MPGVCRVDHESAVMAAPRVSPGARTQRLVFTESLFSLYSPFIHAFYACVHSSGAGWAGVTGDGCDHASKKET